MLEFEIRVKYTFHTHTSLSVSHGEFLAVKKNE